MSDVDTASRDAALGAIGLTVEMVECGVALEWRGIATACCTKYFAEIMFPGLESKIEVRLIDRTRGEVRIDGKTFGVAVAEQRKSMPVPMD